MEENTLIDITQLLVNANFAEVVLSQLILYRVAFAVMWKDIGTEISIDDTPVNMIRYLTALHSSRSLLNDFPSPSLHKAIDDIIIKTETNYGARIEEGETAIRLLAKHDL